MLYCIDRADYSKTGQPLMKADHHDKIYYYCDRCFHVSGECKACGKRTKGTNLITEEITHCVDGCENQVDDCDYKSVYL